MAAALMATEWTCSRCGVKTSYQADSDVPASPLGWAQGADGWRCLACRRDEVIEAAAPSNQRTAAMVRRRALTEFELLRDPDASDVVIARRAKCPTGTVAPVRAALRQAGRLDPADELSDIP